jgi:hypothetical protein
MLLFLLSQYLILNAMKNLNLSLMLSLICLDHICLGICYLCTRFGLIRSLFLISIANIIMDMPGSGLFCNLTIFALLILYIFYGFICSLGLYMNLIIILAIIFFIMEMIIL